MLLLRKLIFLNQILLTFLIVVHPKGPTHRKFAMQCMEQIAIQAYNFTKAKGFYRTKFLLAFSVSRHIQSPGYEIQEDILKMLHGQKLWSIEVSHVNRTEFNSYSENCIEDLRLVSTVNSTRLYQPPSCVRKHVLQLKTNFYIIVIDNLQSFYRRLYNIINGSNFNWRALFIVYYTKITTKSYEIALELVVALYENSIANMIILVPRSITKFGLFVLRRYNGVGVRCFSEIDTRMGFQCNDGKLRSRANIFKQSEVKNYHNCFVNVKAIPIEPFVISTSLGIEPTVLKEIGKSLNISFAIEIDPNATIQLGVRDSNGSWTGFLEPIYENWELGIGNISPDKELVEDFTFSLAYYYAQVVLVIPIAPIIPRWRVLMAIFTTEMWAICLSAIFGFAIAFYVFKPRNEVETFKKFHRCLIAAYQIIQAHPVAIQPICDSTRVLFISQAIFAIVINAVYTTSLIYYLQNTIREYQITTGRETQERNMTFGGSPKFREMFKSSPTKNAENLLRNYQTVDESMDTYHYWLERVAERNCSTIAIKATVNYLLLRNDPIVTTKHNEPKVFIIPKALRVQQVGIIMRKGHFLEDSINYAIQKLLVESGIITKIKSDYLQKNMILMTQSVDDDESDEDKEEHSKVTPISSHHLEGAFALLALGFVLGFFAFLMELDKHSPSLVGSILESWIIVGLNLRDCDWENANPITIHNIHNTYKLKSIYFKSYTCKI